jgi:hypothetical protein
MNRRLFLSLSAAIPFLQAAKPGRRTEVAIRKDGFLINGRPTYRHRTFQGRKVEGLLMNVRLVQGIFDDLNPATRNSWIYPDTGTWDPERNTTEFLAALRDWRQNGVLSFTINLQGGVPGPGVGRAPANPTAGRESADHSSKIRHWIQMATSGPHIWPVLPESWITLTNWVWW